MKRAGAVKIPEPVEIAPAEWAGPCGKQIPGWTYWDYDDPRKPGFDKVLHQSRCENGWIRRTLWREVPGMVDEQGNKLWQPYEFSGRCKCSGGNL